MPNFYHGVTPLKMPQKRPHTMKTFTVYLFRAPECIRGWLAYLRPEHSRCTITVSVKAENGTKAKNKAITCANKGFKGIEVIGGNYDDKIFGLNNFPELKKYVEDLNRWQR
uniref:Uncharacterized protein n=1 Tax=viral metagenome TaxID=1070528 RepID=A0A6M3J329_9ZZZZ